MRSLWLHIDAMLLAIKEEQITMETVLKGDVDQYVLDGMDRVLNIPRCLKERIEQLPHQVTIRGSSCPPFCLEVKLLVCKKVLNFCVF